MSDMQGGERRPGRVVGGPTLDAADLACPGSDPRPCLPPSFPIRRRTPLGKDHGRAPPSPTKPSLAGVKARPAHGTAAVEPAGCVNGSHRQPISGIRCEDSVHTIVVVTSRSIDEAPPPGIARRLDQTFKIGLILKAADGILEIVSELFLLLVRPSAIDRLAHTLTAHELGQDPRDRIANYILHRTGHLSSGATLFGAVYLLSLGVAKVVLVFYVLPGRLWAYPVAIRPARRVHRLPAVRLRARQDLVGFVGPDCLRRVPGVADLA